MRYTPSGTPFTSFSLAVNNNRRDPNGDGWIEETEWFRVTAWERQAELVNQYLAKGRRVFVDGRLSTRQYTSSSGEARTSLEVRAFRVVFLESAGGDTTETGEPLGAQSYSSGDATQQTTTENNPSEDVEELPW